MAWLAQYPLPLTLDRATCDDAKLLNSQGVTKVIAIGCYSLNHWLWVKPVDRGPGTPFLEGQIFLVEPFCFAEFEGVYQEETTAIGDWLSEKAWEVQQRGKKNS